MQKACSQEIFVKRQELRVPVLRQKLFVHKPEKRKYPPAVSTMRSQETELQALLLTLQITQRLPARGELPSVLPVGENSLQCNQQNSGVPRKKPIKLSSELKLIRDLEHELQK